MVSKRGMDLLVGRGEGFEGVHLDIEKEHGEAETLVIEERRAGEKKRKSRDGNVGYTDEEIVLRARRRIGKILLDFEHIVDGEI